MKAGILVTNGAKSLMGEYHGHNRAREVFL